jgi:hypothetical protein
MLSKVLIDINCHRQEHISVRWNNSDDPRDKLVHMFLQTACPDGLPESAILDGYCRISILGKTSEGGIVAEIVPIHPLEMPKHIELIKENSGKITNKANPVAKHPIE